MFHHRKTDIAIIGAGPCGLVAANVLAQAGADFVLLDQKARPSAHSYGLALHPDTLDLLAGLGLADPVLERALIVRRAAVFDERHAQRAVVDYGQLDAKHPYLAIIGQNLLEEILLDGLRQKGRHPLWHHRLRYLEPEDDRAARFTVDRLVEGMSGYAVAHIDLEIDKVLDYEAAFVIATDGFNSGCRRSAGIALEPVGPGLDYAVFEFETNVRLPGEMRLIVDGRHTHVFWPLPDGRCRFSFQMGEHFADPDSLVKDQHLIDIEAANAPELRHHVLEDLLEHHAPWFIGESKRLRWRAKVRFEPRLAERFTRGRLALAGDSAHIVPPAGVLGMNVGMCEAAELARRLASATDDPARRAELEAYDRGRRTSWTGLLDRAGSIRPADAEADWLLEHRENLIGSLPISPAHLEAILAQLHLTQAA